MNASIPTASHYGVVHFGNPDCEAIVLTTGERGYVRKELTKLLGFHELHEGGRFARFLADIAPNSLLLLEKPSGLILLLSGRQIQFFPANIIVDVAIFVVDTAIVGTLHHVRQDIVGNYLMIMRVLTTTGEVALIDEATGYQRYCAPDALQELISKLLCQSCASWRRCFHPDYYRTIYRLSGWKCQGHDQNPPHVVGQITLRWVYGPVLPEDLLGETRNHKGILQKHHQWLSDQGLAHLESQIHAVMATTYSSMSYPNLKRRCETAFAGVALQSGLLLDELEERV